MFEFEGKSWIKIPQTKDEVISITREWGKLLVNALAKTKSEHRAKS